MPLSYSESKVCLFFQGVKLSLTNRARLKTYILSIFKTEGKRPGIINYVFSTDKTLLGLNRQYLGHDTYTDIITFDLSESSVIQAEIYISPARIKENARDLGVSFTSELHRVIFHGVLHLCGYKDKTKREKQKMRTREDFYLDRYFK